MTEEIILKKKQMMTITQIKDQDIANSIESCAMKNKFWIDEQKIAKQLQTSVNTIQQIVNDSEKIVVKSDGTLTTRDLYRKKTPFFDKLLNNIKNKID